MLPGYPGPKASSLPLRHRHHPLPIGTQRSILFGPAPVSMVQRVLRLYRPSRMSFRLHGIRRLMKERASLTRMLLTPRQYPALVKVAMDLVVSIPLRSMPIIQVSSANQPLVHLVVPSFVWQSRLDRNTFRMWSIQLTHRKSRFT